MKKLYFLLFMLMAFTSYGQNLAANGGFENWTTGTPDGFTTIDFSTTDLTQNTNAAFVTEGTSSASVNVLTQSQGSTDIRQDIALLAGVTYTISLDVYATNNEARARIFNGNGFNPSQYSDETLLNQWQTLSFEYTPTANEDFNMGIRFYDLATNWTAGTQSSLFYIDNLQVLAAVDPSIAVTSPSSGTVLNPGTTSVDLTWATANLTGNEFVNVIVNMGTPSSVAPTATPFAISTTNGASYNVTVELRDAGNTLLDSDMTSFSVATPNTATDIAALRAGTIGDFYELSGEAIISYIVTENTRNQKYIQDGTAGILIDDSAGTLSTSFNIGDGITGLKGTLGQFGGVLQFVPAENVATASSTGNTITPEVVTLADFVASGENYESELIQINALSFSDIGSFADNTNYAVTSGMDASTVRVAFGDEDLIGTGIPTVPGFVIGLGGEFNGTYQILPRYYADVENAVLSNNDFETREFSIYPNPTNTGSVNITSVNATPIAVTIFDILGKQVKNATISNNRLDVSNLKSGIYLLRLTQDGATSTKKLVIR
ncbi:T9SS type A sorting domain-containing protein [uncultured Winogradskyella sp.]|jgi:hypothetical protein|uniref:T9SS type A sorting domain-containing protein n=1 Tax=uncultured Winogradskyella sp. TaxID=395353 RepID=UPI0025D109E7|nr:T9SS type A sorting domain-containing protein [uncultured Winogradskyella sp.]